MTTTKLPQIGDTPGLYEHDRHTLDWAVKFRDRADMAELLGDGAAEAIASHHNGYPELCGHARVVTGQLLGIIERMAERARRDAAEITRLRDLLTVEQIKASR